MSVVEGRADIKICCVRSTSTGTRRVVRPSGWGVVNSLARRGCGPVGVIQAHKVRVQYKKPIFCRVHLLCGWVGVVKSLERMGGGPAGLIHTQKVEAKYKQLLCVRKELPF